MKYLSYTNDSSDSASSDWFTQNVLLLAYRYEILLKQKHGLAQSLRKILLGGIGLGRGLGLGLGRGMGLTRLATTNIAQCHNLIQSQDRITLII